MRSCEAGVSSGEARPAGECGAYLGLLREGKHGGGTGQRPRRGRRTKGVSVLGAAARADDGKGDVVGRRTVMGRRTMMRRRTMRLQAFFFFFWVPAFFSFLVFPRRRGCAAQLRLNRHAAAAAESRRRHVDDLFFPPLPCRFPRRHRQRSGEASSRSLTKRIPTPRRRQSAIRQPTQRARQAVDHGAEPALVRTAAMARGPPEGADGAGGVLTGRLQGAGQGGDHLRGQH